MACGRLCKNIVPSAGDSNGSSVPDYSHTIVCEYTSGSYSSPFSDIFRDNHVYGLSGVNVTMLKDGYIVAGYAGAESGAIKVNGKMLICDNNGALGSYGNQMSNSMLLPVKKGDVIEVGNWDGGSYGDGSGGQGFTGIYCYIPSK